MRFPIFSLSIALLSATVPDAAPAQAPTIALNPAIVEVGSPELIRVTAPQGAKVEGEWQGHILQFFPAAELKIPGKQTPALKSSTAATWYALAGVDLKSPTGPAPIKISIRLNDKVHELTSTQQIRPAHYRTSAINVEPKFVEPGPDAQKQIESDKKLKDKVLSTSAAQPLWSGDFMAPVKAQPTDSFGTRRTFNGKLASIHQGTDFRAATGTPVLAGNSGTVVLAQQLYYEGNCVMIDHGLGLTSISMHLSRIDVKPGEQVKRGQQIGLSGATGRVTGPHLHWAIRWQNSYLDPAKLLRLDLEKAH